MTLRRPFAQVDVFGTAPGTGNPVAVVLDATGLSTAEMQAFARWTNLSETTFVLPPTPGSGADYAVRIFTPGGELPFAGHPTLGTCHAWLDGRSAERVMQECAAGPVQLRRTAGGLLAFAAPPLVRDGPVDAEDLAHVLEACGLSADRVVAARWVDNGPGWLGVLLRSAEDVLAVRRPHALALKLGLAAVTAPGAGHELEVRAFFPEDGTVAEDPVTGSLNASLGQWLLGDGLLAEPYVARQGTAIGRDGRVHVSAADGDVWVAGATTTVVTGHVAL
nr:PhzF family phenazine biosynthesis protein [Paraconexibacter algicola]